MILISWDLSLGPRQATANLNGVRIASNKGEGLEYDIPGNLVYEACAGYSFGTEMLNFQPWIFF